MHKIKKESGIEDRYDYKYTPFDRKQELHKLKGIREGNPPFNWSMDGQADAYLTHLASGV